MSSNSRRIKSAVLLFSALVLPLGCTSKSHDESSTVRPASSPQREARTAHQIVEAARSGDIGGALKQLQQLVDSGQPVPGPVAVAGSFQALVDAWQPETTQLFEIARQLDSGEIQTASAPLLPLMTNDNAEAFLFMAIEYLDRGENAAARGAVAKAGIESGTSFALAQWIVRVRHGESVESPPAATPDSRLGQHCLFYAAFVALRNQDVQSAEAALLRFAP